MYWITKSHNRIAVSKCYRTLPDEPKFGCLSAIYYAAHATKKVKLETFIFRFFFFVFCRKQGHRLQKRACMHVCICVKGKTVGFWQPHDWQIFVYIRTLSIFVHFWPFCHCAFNATYCFQVTDNSWPFRHTAFRHFETFYLLFLRFFRFCCFLLLCKIGSSLWHSNFICLH